MRASCTLTSFSEQDIESLRPAMKIGILATVNAEGLPHVTLLSSLQAASATTLTFGQFIEGRSKSFLRRNPRAGFLVMTLQREIWRGAALFSRTERAGREFDEYNQVPMFRYNAYFGIHTVYYLDLVRHGGKESLPMGRTAAAALGTAAAGAFHRPPKDDDVLNPWTRRLLGGLANPKFAAWIGPDGYPRIVPAFPARAVSGRRILCSVLAYREELEEIPAGAAVALFGMTLSMEDVLVRGTFRGIQGTGPARCLVMDVDWVYNPMPPVPGQIYPAEELRAVTDFQAKSP